MLVLQSECDTVAAMKTVIYKRIMRENSRPEGSRSLVLFKRGEMWCVPFTITHRNEDRNSDIKNIIVKDGDLARENWVCPPLANYVPIKGERTRIFMTFKPRE